MYYVQRPLTIFLLLVLTVAAWWSIRLARADAAFRRNLRGGEAFRQVRLQLGIRHSETFSETFSAALIGIPAARASASMRAATFGSCSRMCR